MARVVSLLMVAGGVAFGILAVLAATGLVDPLLAATAFGIAMLAMGVDELAGALVAGWVPRGCWQPSPGRRPTARVGRLVSLGAGLVHAATGVVFIGIGWMPRPVLLAAVAVFVAGFVLLVAGSYDRRRAEAARAGTDAEHVYGPTCQ